MHVLKNRKKFLKNEKRICGVLADGLNKIKGVKVYGLHTLPSRALFFPMGKTDSGIAEKLAERGIAVRGGLHCAPLAHRTAGTLETGTVRLSPCGENRAWEAEKALRELKRVIKSL